MYTSTQSVPKCNHLHCGNRGNVLLRTLLHKVYQIVITCTVAIGECSPAYTSTQSVPKCNHLHCGNRGNVLLRTLLHKVYQNVITCTVAIEEMEAEPRARAVHSCSPRRSLSYYYPRITEKSPVSSSLKLALNR